MVSRRRFLQLGTAAASSTLIAPSRAQQNSAGKIAPLPPSVANLRSMKDQAKPISQEERRERQEKARRLMQASKLDAILLTEGTSLTYFTGMHWWGGERLFTMVLPGKGKAFYVCPGFEEGRAREQLQKAPDGPEVDVRIWQEDENPYRHVAQGLKDRGISTGTVGMEETVRFVFSDGVAHAAPQARITSATPVTAGCRMVKSAHEIELMRLAAKVTLTAYEAAYRALEEGMTQHEFSDLVEAAHSQLGFAGGADVEVGEYSALPHGSITPQVIRDGTILLIDGGCKVEGYASDISRTFVLGKPTDKMKHVFDIVHKAQTTARATARPGLECGAVDGAARKVITDAGYGPDYKFFTHRVGHGMGMDGHEWPYLVRGNPTPLAADMTFSDEPGIYLRGEFGVRLEDDMHITEDGAELFTPQSLSLENPFASV
jgi:Xaa-Pro aminopeptidase